MTLPTSMIEALRARSRELVLVCDGGGVILEADDRATCLLGARAGLALAALAVPGTADKVRALVMRAAVGPVADWELALVCEGRPVTFSFQSETFDGEIHLLGLRLPSEHSQLVARLNEAVADLVELNREVARHRRLAEERSRALESALDALEESHRAVRALHEQIELRAADLEAALQRQRRTMAALNHELRTPLQAILGHVELLLVAPHRLGPQQLEDLRSVQTATAALTAIVDDMLELARAESGRTPLRIERFRILDLFSVLRGLLRPLVEREAELALVFEPPAQPDVEVESDLAKVVQILQNLVANALKYTERGEVRVSFSSDGGQVLFRVRDTGVGIASPERIFEEFERIEGARPHAPRGTGLGLPLSRRFAALLGGTLTVESAVGHGSTFTLVLPAHPPSLRGGSRRRSRGRRPGSFAARP